MAINKYAHMITAYIFKKIPKLPQVSVNLNRINIITTITMIATVVKHL